ncbi:hypothetical protein [Alkalilimnicola ehrlichii]|uniref:hypothetical protein n=1 Tax=Alkalilimnicola ehrlichii TaxID=351052 RepID=UPI0011C05E72|nr:hypothetical protein [Alkalilimnicola ehrlichii]
MSDRFGRRPLQIVEIDEDFCPLIYGEAPCSAELGVTGVRKCYNRFRSCQSVSSYERGTLTLRFAKPQSGLPKGMTVFPALVSVSTNPTSLNVGGSDKSRGPLGRRATVTVKLKDFSYHDRYTDKYARERVTGEAQIDEPGYNPAKRGTFFGKYRKRNPYYQGRAMRVREGYEGQLIEEMRTRHYVITKFVGPNSSGEVTFEAKDVLDLADNERAVAPRPGSGALDREIDEQATSFNLLPEGVGAEYPVAGRAVIGSEMVEYSRSGDAITLTARGVRTEVASHDEGDTFQPVLTFHLARIDEVIKTLLIDYAGISPEFIPDDEWQEEAETWLNSFQLTRDITEPTGVTSLIGELSELGPYIWWDELAQKIRLRANRPPGAGAVPLLSDGRDIVKESTEATDRPDERITQVWIYYGQIDPTGSVDDAANYRRLRVTPDLAAQSPEQYGDTRIKRIFTPWMTGGNEGEVLAISNRLLARYRDTPRRISLKTDAKDRGLWTGDVADLLTRIDEDETGRPEANRWQVISAEEVEPGHRVKFVFQSFEFVGRYAFFTPDDYPDYGSADPSQRNFGAWFAPSGDGFPDGTEAYQFI